MLNFHRLSACPDLGYGGIMYTNRQTSRSPRPLYIPPIKPRTSKSPNFSRTRDTSKSRSRKTKTKDRDNSGSPTSNQSPFMQPDHQSRVIISR
jgi:hypothetical protein